MKTQPLSIRVAVTCRVTGELYDYDITLENYDNIEADVLTYLDEEGWIDQCSPGYYDPEPNTDYEYELGKAR